MLKTRKLNHEDYDTILKKWWDDWGWVAPTRDFLPEDGTGGIIVYDDDRPVFAGFMYATNSKVAWVDWIISDKDYRPPHGRGDAIVLLVSMLTDIAKKAGFKFAYALIKHESLMYAYTATGYIKGDSYTNEMIKAL